ncbi:MAG: TIGR00153 family protein [Desulfobacterales bacterium]|jgi:predicted phosphate transport protein (TIGR00153 family)
MRIPFLSMFVTSPFEGLQEHAEKVHECALVFQEAMECYISEECERFEDFRQDIHRIEGEADAVKRRIRGHLPKGTLLQYDKFELFRYLGEQDKVLDAMEESLDWISIRRELGIPQSLAADIKVFVDAVTNAVEELSKMTAEAQKYFRSYSNDQRAIVKNMIHSLRRKEHHADKLEDGLKKKIFDSISDPVTVFHLVKMAEIIGAIADHAENAGDMMRAMIAV